MNRLLTRMLSGLLLVAFVAGTFGCQAARVKEERDALYVQNQELQDEVDRLRQALDLAMSERDAAIAELNRLQNQPPPPAPAPEPQRSGFESIEGVETIRSAGAITVRVPGDVLFASGKVDLKQSSKQTLDRIAGVLQSEHPNNIIRVEGYTDTDPIRKSKWKDNLELSLQRAAAVHRYLQSRGISADRMYAAGYGETKPLSSKAQSRRVEVVVVLQE